MYQCKKEKIDYVLAQKEKNIHIELVDNGQCVRLIQELCKAPGPANLIWKQGEKVKGNSQIRPGTAIATFVEGKYPNNSHGNHAAIYLSQTQAGIRVIDQWASPSGKNRGVSTRVISFKNHGPMSDDGEKYYVIE